MKNKILALGLVLALEALMVIPMAVSAASSGTSPVGDTTTVQGNIGTVYTITVPTTITLGPFVAAAAYTDTGKSVSVSTNDTGVTKCGITVKDAKTSSTGFLTLAGADDASKELTNALTVKGGTLGSYTSLALEQTLIASTTLIASANFSNFAVSQTIASGDLTKTAGTYSLVMTFTATFGN
jgi:hypothetical protein